MGGGGGFVFIMYAVNHAESDIDMLYVFSAGRSFRQE